MQVSAVLSATWVVWQVHKANGLVSNGTMLLEANMLEYIVASSTSNVRYNCKLCKVISSSRGTVLAIASHVLLCGDHSHPVLHRLTTRRQQ